MRSRIPGLVCAVALPVLLRAATPSMQPNVLLIISDDQGYGDLGFTGNPIVRTPHLDRLATESAVFRNFVVTPACSPTRVAMFSGRNHLLTGVWGVPPRANFRDDEARMPAFFKAAGYRTLHVGKLDSVRVGAHGDPRDFGWEDYLGGSGYEHRDPMMWRPKNSARGKGWTADLWTDFTLEFIRKRQDEPWFITLAYILPHLPWICPESYSAPFLEQGLSANLAALYGSIAHLDASVGRLLAGLREAGQEERTIVIFISDNGAAGPEAKAAAGDGVVPGEDWARRNVARLRGSKARVWENGIRVPWLIRWPGRIKPGERRQFGSVEDILPTLLDLAGIRADVTAHLPFCGVSLLPALEDAGKVFDRPDVLRMAISGPGSPRAKVADPRDRKYEDHHLTLRGARFKYHALPGGRSALYDLAADPGETTDVSAMFPDVAARMARQCREQWDAILATGRAFAPMPEGEKKTGNVRPGE